MLCLSTERPCPAAGGRLGSSSKLGEMPLLLLSGRRAAPCLDCVGRVLVLDLCGVGGTGLTRLCTGQHITKNAASCLGHGAGGCAAGNVPSASSQHTSQGSDHTSFGVDEVVSTPAPEAALSFLSPLRTKCSFLPPSQVCFPPAQPCWARQCSSQSCSVSSAWGTHRCSTWDHAQTHQCSRISISTRCEVILKPHSRQ